MKFLEALKVRAMTGWKWVQTVPILLWYRQTVYMTYIPRQQFHPSILLANFTRMSLICYEEIGRVGRESYTRMLATCRQQVVLVDF